MTQTPATIALRALLESFPHASASRVPAVAMAEAALAGRGFAYVRATVGDGRHYITAAFADVETARAYLSRTAWASHERSHGVNLDDAMRRHGFEIIDVPAPAPRGPALGDFVVLTEDGADPITCTLADFIRHNADGMGDEMGDVLDALQRGETYTTGGGAAAVYTLSLVPAE